MNYRINVEAPSILAIVKPCAIITQNTHMQLVSLASLQMLYSSSILNKTALMLHFKRIMTVLPGMHLSRFTRDDGRFRSARTLNKSSSVSRSDSCQKKCTIGIQSSNNEKLNIYE